MNSPRLVLVQVRTTNPDLTPDLLKGKVESCEENKTRMARLQDGGNGELVVPSTSKVSIRPFLWGVEEAGYILADASLTVRPGEFKDTYVIRYIFVHPDSFVENKNKKFVRDRDLIKGELYWLAEDATWDAEVYDNPFFENGLPAEGQHTLCVNLCGSDSLVDDSGQPTMVWQRDEKGQQMRHLPKVPKEPKHRLYFDTSDDELVFVA